MIRGQRGGWAAERDGSAEWRQRARVGQRVVNACARRCQNHTSDEDGWGYKQVDSGCSDFVGNMTDLWRKVTALLTALSP